ncbi:glycogen debranching N-terminal domain-containing protein [Lysobacter sp. Root494]|uniref:amylo-alpha-1,6-glucosidase n=1 Tax=Lysobacter sp. Root494 TaxID=1736549 RepID=UPI00191001D5|nr:glycogen debranching N-terminal domain-containing protein [Lysobacter sp. Root494]
MDRSLVLIRVRDDTVYVGHGGTVLATDRHGFLHEGIEHGLFVDQTRLLSRYRCLVDGKPPLPVAQSKVAQHSWLGYYLIPGTTQRDRHADLTAPEGAAQEAVELRISRVVGDGLHEDLDIANYTQGPVALRLQLDIDADFADQEETRKARQQHGMLTRTWRVHEDARELVFDYKAEHRYDVQGNRGVATLHRGVTLRIDHADSLPVERDGHVEFAIELPARGRWHACLRWIPCIDGARLLPPRECRAFLPDRSRHGPEAVFLREATAFDSPESDTLAPVVVDALVRARRDLLALRLSRYDRGPRAWTVAAGLPMYLALFGRDTLTVAWEAALLGPELMRGTLPALAELQGTESNDWRDEQPGRMLHEAHTGPLEQLNFTPKGRYYGAHTTSAFYPFVIAQLWHWTADREAVAPFVEPARKAIRWLDRWKGPKGLHRYQTRSIQGVENQGWKDSHDAIVHADGSVVAAPIATCEEQGLVYAAKLNFAEVLWWFDHKDEARRMFDEARELKQRFNDAFWMADERFFAMALDPQQQQVRSIASNALHCVATGIAGKDHVLPTMERLFAPDMFTGWGIRTLSSEHPAYNPYSYHRGTVWPVEHGPFAVGAYRYGLHDRVEQICKAQFEAAALFEHRRLPELFGGHPRDADHPFPALYPAANSPQAWSATTVFTLLQAMFGLQPFAPFRMLFVDPHLPAWLPEIRLRGLRVADVELSLRFYRNPGGSSDYEILEQRGQLHVIRQPSPWSLTANFGERLKDLVLSALPGR